jgi:predicted metal-dependent hydrolase
MTVALTQRPARALILPDGRLIHAGVRASPVARTMRIRVGMDRPLEILVPAAATDDAVDDALRAKLPWIAHKLGVVDAHLGRPSVLSLDQPGLVWLDGGCLRVRKVVGERSMATRRADELVVAGADPVGAVQRWYRREARLRACQFVRDESGQLGVAPSTVSVRDQRTRWGSCSSRGAISINWRVAVAPADVQRYVVVHELCHLIVPNHRKPFWRLLDAALPGWRQADRWLRSHGGELRGYTPSP